MDKHISNLYKSFCNLALTLENLGKKVKDENHHHEINEINGLKQELDDVKKRLDDVEDFAGIKEK